MTWEAVAKLLGSVVLVLSRMIEDNGNPEVKAAMLGLDQLIDAVRAGEITDLKPEAVRAEVDKLFDRIMVDRQSADAALDKRFPDEP